MPRFRTISLSLFHTSTSLFSFFLPFFLFNSLHRYPYLFSDIGRVSKLLHGGPYSALGREPRGRSLFPRARRSQSPTTRNSRRLRRPSDATRRLEITTKDRARNPASWMVRFVIKKKTAKDVAKTERLATSPGESNALDEDAHHHDVLPLDEELELLRTLTLAATSPRFLVVVVIVVDALSHNGIPCDFRREYSYTNVVIATLAPRMHAPRWCIVNEISC